MKLSTPCLLAAFIALPHAATASGFLNTRIESDGQKLVLIPTEGLPFPAPMLDGQDSFDHPAVSPNRQYAGWLALFPDRGASYSQPLYLVVLSTERKRRDFKPPFGMVFGWCFSKDSTAVVYRHEFPHGITPIGFEMRRLKDGRLLRRVELPPAGPDADPAAAVRAAAPAWTRCAQEPFAAR